jgi:hypothetical protein
MSLVAVVLPVAWDTFPVVVEATFLAVVAWVCRMVAVDMAVEVILLVAAATPEVAVEATRHMAVADTAVKEGMMIISTTLADETIEIVAVMTATPVAVAPDPLRDVMTVTDAMTETVMVVAIHETAIEETTETDDEAEAEAHPETDEASVLVMTEMTEALDVTPVRDLKIGMIKLRSFCTFGRPSVVAYLLRRKSE